MNPQGTRDNSVIERTIMRNAIVDGFTKCLPQVERKLIFGPEKAAVKLVRHQEGKLLVYLGNIS